MCVPWVLFTMVLRNSLSFASIASPNASPQASSREHTRAKKERRSPRAPLRARSFFLLGADEKMPLAASLGHLITSSPLEALVMPGDRCSEKRNVIEVGQMAILLQVKREHHQRWPNLLAPSPPTPPPLTPCTKGV